VQNITQGDSAHKSTAISRPSDAGEAVALVVWRQSLIGDLWRPGRRNAPALRAELRRTERRLVDFYWPHWREAA